TGRGTPWSPRTPHPAPRGRGCRRDRAGPRGPGLPRPGPLGIPSPVCSAEEQHAPHPGAEPGPGHGLEAG
ncbi:hypothetical protein NGM37_17005, partial [Streptomyces sp. TRM76130]|nr:hypothetical protein [Streptomyces sp. TRM76130]